MELHTRASRGSSYARRRPVPVSVSSPVRLRAFAINALLLSLASCAASNQPTKTPSPDSPPGVLAAPPRIVRIDPMSGGGASKPPALAALEEELQRGMRELGGKGKPPPYYIAYEIHNRDDVTVAASYGALVQSSTRHARILDTDVRVGSYKLDSTHTIRSNDFDFSSMSGGGHPVALPLSDDASALRAVAWRETDRRYNEAAERLVKIKTQRTLKVADEDPSDDFSREKPASYLGAPSSLTLDVPAWEQRIRQLSARFRGQADILDSGVTLQASSLTRWFVNSEGSLVQTGRNYVRVYLEASARADDGMELERFETFDAATFDGLGSNADMEKAADAIIADLRTLRKAPLSDPYIGPAILEGRAAGVFFHEIFGHRVEGHRQKNEEEGQTFAKKIGEPIMPAFVSVYDDPTLARLGGADLNGFYRFDDEGVVAQRATLVSDGVLRGFLLSRSPTRGFSQSNGHGRRQEGRSIVSRQGNLVVEPKRFVSVTELRDLLRAEAKRQGKLYGLSFRDISGGFTNTQRGGPQAFKVLADPRLPGLGRRPSRRARARGRSGRHAAGGAVAHHRRVGRLPDVQRLLRRRVRLRARVGDQPEPAGAADRGRAARQGERQAAAAAGAGAHERKPGVYAQGGAVMARRWPVAFVLLVAGAAGDAGADSLAKPSAEPAMRVNPASVRKAMEDELARSMKELHMGDDEPRPYFIAYTISDLNQATTSATLGAMTAAHAYRGRLLRTEMRVGDANFDNSNFEGGTQVEAIPIEDDYAALRREIWLRSDEAYKNAVETLARKRSAAAGQAAADEDDGIADFSPQAAARVEVPFADSAADPEALRETVRKLSQILASFPEIYGSHVTGHDRDRPPAAGDQRGDLGRRQPAHGPDRRRRRHAGGRRHEAAQLRAVLGARAVRAAAVRRDGEGACAPWPRSWWPRARRPSRRPARARCCSKGRPRRSS